MIFCFIDYSSVCGYDEIPIDVSIYQKWRMVRLVESLRYLWKPVELVVRRIHWITRRSDPRWGCGRWKAKT